MSVRFEARPSRWIFRASFLDAAALALVLVVPAVAQDPPHWLSTSVDIDCTSQCHVGHHATGSTLTPEATNAALCQSCHNSSGLAADLPINSSDMAAPGMDGTSHAWGAQAVNATYGALAPQDAQMQLRLPGDNIICSTCHNQHKAESGFGGTPRVAAAALTTALGSTGAVTSGGTFSGAEGLWYLVEVVQAGNETSARFCYSKDNGISWSPTGCDPPGTTTPNLTAGVDVALDSGVTVSFGSGNFAIGERWEFSAAYPFLRAAMEDGAGSSAICRDCHRDWVMTHSEVRTYDGGYKSHPVGVALNANGGDYDRAVPLDGDGGAPGSDGNASNDLALDGSGNVHCLTCHGVHYADSNTQTVDVP